MCKDAIVSWSGEFAARELEAAYRESQAAQEVRQLRVIWVVAMAFFLAFAPLDYFQTGNSGLHLIIRLAIVATAALVVALMSFAAARRRRDVLASLALVVSMAAYGGLLGQRETTGAGALLLLLLGSYLFSPSGFVLHVITGLSGSALALLTAVLSAGGSWGGALEFSYLLPANLLAAIALAQANRSRRTLYRQRLALEVEVRQKQAAQVRLAAANRRNLTLLYNALPRQVARQLQRDPGCRPSRLVEGVGILFTDIVGFSDLSRRLAAEELVALLNQLFSLFDELAAEHGLEKIKTIGDAYLAIAGLNDEPAAISEAARMALAQHQAAQRLVASCGTRLVLRSGLHVGPVVAGVLGRQRYAFDVWGSSVNVASRLEASAPPGGILVSASARRRCGPELVFGAGRQFELRGCGRFDASLLLAGPGNRIP